MDQLQRVGAIWGLLVAGALGTMAEAAPGQLPGFEPAADENSQEREATGPDQRPGYDETLVVTASRVEEPILESPVSITVLDRQDLQNAPSEQPTDLLRGVPGLNGIQLTARDSQFSARTAAGVMGPRLLTLVDGRSVYLDHQGIVLFDGLSFGTDEIAQIEILKGPGSSMWGANALAGVVNFRTRSPSELLGGLVEIEGGENGYARLGLRWAARTSDRLSFKVSGSYLEQDAWPRDPLTAQGQPISPEFLYRNEGTEQPKFDLRVDYQAAADVLWSYRAGYGGVGGMILSGLGPLSLRDDFYQAYGEVRRNAPAFDLHLYWNRAAGDTLNLLGGDVLSSTTDTLVAELSGRLEARGRHRLVYGFNARHNEFDLSWAAAADARDEWGGFVEDEITINPRLRVALGGRVDHFDTIGTTFSPRLSLFLAPRWNHVFRLTYNRAYRAPTAIENHMDVLTTNPVALAPGLPLFPLLVRGLGSEELREEGIDAIELGYAAILGGRHELAVAVYRNTIEDSIEFATTDFYGPTDPPPGWPFPAFLTPPFPKTFSAFNADEVREGGAELSLATNWNEHWQTNFAYAYQDQPEIESTTAPYPMVLNSPPRHQASVTLTGTTDQWSGALTVAFTDEAYWRDVLDERFWGPTDAYTHLHGSLTHTVSERLSLTLRGTNLTDDQTKQHAYGDLIGRQVTLRVRLRY